MAQENVIVKARHTIPIVECGEKLIELSAWDFVLEPMYFNWGYARTPKIGLRESVAEKLLAARDNLRKSPGRAGWNFKIWDGYRTLEVQSILYQNYLGELTDRHSDWPLQKLHEAVQIFVSEASHDPKAPSPHNTGGAVDLTLIDEKGQEVEMGSAFDEFNEKSYTDHFREKNPAIHSNRMFLKKILEQVGFKNYPEEWWHFAYGDQEWALLSGKKQAIYGSLELGDSESVGAKS